MMASLFLRTALIAAAIGAALVASAQNIVRDGDFESATGTPGTLTTFNTGQTLDGFFTVTLLSPSGIVGIDDDDGFQITGDKSLLLFHGSVTQNLTTVPGQTYSIAFDADCGGGTTTAFVTFGGTSLTAIVPHATTHFVLSATATATSTPLSFAAMNDQSFELDNANVMPVATPEPSALAALGLGVAAVLRRRKRP